MWTPIGSAPSAWVRYPRIISLPSTHVWMSWAVAIEESTRKAYFQQVQEAGRNILSSLAACSKERKQESSSYFGVGKRWTANPKAGCGAIVQTLAFVYTAVNGMHLRSASAGLAKRRSSLSMGKASSVTLQCRPEPRECCARPSRAIFQLFVLKRSLCPRYPLIGSNLDRAIHSRPHLREEV